MLLSKKLYNGIYRYISGISGQIGQIGQLAVRNGGEFHRFRLWVDPTESASQTQSWVL